LPEVLPLACFVKKSLSLPVSLVKHLLAGDFESLRDICFEDEQNKTRQIRFKGTMSNHGNLCKTLGFRDVSAHLADGV